MANSSDSFNIVDLFYQSAKKTPNKTAIIYKNANVSFHEFEKQVTDTANYFISKGIAKKDNVLVFVPMSLHLYRIVLALFRIGATAVFLDEWVNKNRMEQCCKVANCKAIIGNYKVKILSIISKELRKIPINLGISYSKTCAKKDFPITNLKDTALITFTTGSTGIPKAAKRTHGFLQAQFNALIDKVGKRDNEIDMPVLPIVLLMNLGTSTTSVIADFKASKPDSLNPIKITQQLIKYKVNRIIASPFFIKQVAKYVIKSSIQLPELQSIYTGGAPVFPAEAEIYAQAFPQVNFEIVYGSTECEPISGINLVDLVKEKPFILAHGLAVGQVDKNAEVMIIKMSDEIITCSSQNELDKLKMPENTIGEIIVSGKHVLTEYLNNPEALKRNKIFVNNKCWHRTGDSGYFNETGNLFLTGRCNTLVNINGKIIAPFIYENYFQTIAGVEIGTILLYGNKLDAIIEINQHGNKEFIKQNITTISTDFKQIIFIKKIPRDPRHNSKIDYQKLSNDKQYNLLE